MTTVVVSQPMYLPWIGIFDQIALADIFVHYDDVQLPQGRSFCTRVQVKTAEGLRWMTIPLDRKASGRMIHEAVVQPVDSWRPKHLALLHNSYTGAPNVEEMLSFAADTLVDGEEMLANLTIRSVERISRTFGLAPKWKRSSDLGIQGRSSQRLLDICKTLGATRYLTGHGAFTYLDHTAFEAAGIAVEYMVYDPLPWRQLHGRFTPYVTSLDVLAHVPAGEVAQYMRPKTVPWRAFDPNNARP